MKNKICNTRTEQFDHIQNEIIARTPKISFGNAMLMIVSAQNEYLDGALAIPGISSATKEMSRLIAAARKNNTPIIYLQHMDRPGGLFDMRGRGGSFIDALAPDNDEYIVQKTMPNGFAMTNLHDQLQHIGCENLIIAGFMTHMCVAFTARAAEKLGYRACVVANACAATAELPCPDYVGLGCNAHERTLNSLAEHGINIVSDSNEIPL